MTPNEKSHQLPGPQPPLHGSGPDDSLAGASLDAGGGTTGSRSEITGNQQAEPVMKPVDATTPVPPGYPPAGTGANPGE